VGQDGVEAERPGEENEQETDVAGAAFHGLSSLMVGDVENGGLFKKNDRLPRGSDVL
jgi:hypothetical protein